MDSLRKFFLGFFVVAAALGLGQSTARADALANVTASVNLRTGPGTSYAVLGVVPAGAGVTVHSCNSGYSWCDINHRGVRGYIAGRYLTYAVRGQYYGRPLGVYIGVPLFWGSYPIYRPRPPGVRPPAVRPPIVRPPRPRPPGARPPGARPPGARPPGARPPGARPPGARPPGARPPGGRPPSASPPRRRPSGGGRNRGGGGRR